MPSHLVFLTLIYPLVCFYLGVVIFRHEEIPLLYPLFAGGALIGPFAAVLFYEVSRQRERGGEVSWARAFRVLVSRVMWPILALGLLLTLIFLAWLVTAQLLYETIFGPEAPRSLVSFLYEVLTTRRGWMLIVVGHAVGFAFAALAFAVSVVSFPLLLDRGGGLATAVSTSIRAVIASPATMALWGLTVALFLALGCALLFVGLAVVIPVLGHATWHLYRKVVAWPPA
jgi:uncharacterized membrane protein